MTDKQKEYEKIEKLFENEELAFEKAHGLAFVYSNDNVEVGITADGTSDMKAKGKLKDIGGYIITYITIFNPQEYE